MKIEQRKLPPSRKPRKWGETFDQMKPGDSFYFEGKPTTVISSFGFHCAKGRYSVRKEGNGHRFYLVK